MINTAKVQINFDYNSPAIEEIRRNLTCLYTTREGEQPLDRNFGLKIDFLSEPMPIAESKFSLEVVRKTAMYEPRVSVVSVEFSRNEKEGSIVPVVNLRKGDTYERY